MKRSANKQVSPKAAATLILITLIIIQVVWYKGLVFKEKPSGIKGGGGGGGGGVPPPPLVGLKEVNVDTFAGATDPGDADGGRATARFNSPVGIALDSQGNLYVADSRNHRVRRVTPQGKTTTLAGSVQGYADGAAQTAQFNLPCGVAAGTDGAIYVADTGNHRIRKIKDGQVTTLAGDAQGFAEGAGSQVKFNTPCAIATDGKLLYVSDTLNKRIRILDLTGKITGGWQTPTSPTGVLIDKQVVVVAPQTGITAQGGSPLLNIPIDSKGLSANPADYVIHSPVALCKAPEGWFATDSIHHGVFFIKGGKAELIAGQCKPKEVIDGWRDGDGHHANFGSLSGIAWDGKTRVYVSDTSDNCIRILDINQVLTGRRETLP